MGRRMDRIRKQLQELPKGRSSDKRYRALLDASLEHALGEACRRRKQIRANRTATIHCTRLAFKKYRYTAEVLRNLVGLSPARLRAMHAYQTRMGNVQDVELVEAGLRQFLSDRRQLRSPAYTSLLRELRLRRTQAIRDYMESAGEIDGFTAEIRGQTP